MNTIDKNSRSRRLLDGTRPTHEEDLILLLSIKAEHAERIFSGSKHFELRKLLPARSIRRVYLYVTEGVGVLGCFDVASVIRRPVAELWEVVGQAATTRDRFFKYFGKSAEGCAIGVANPVRFEQALPLTALQVDHPRLTAPQSYVVVAPGGSLFGRLENARREALKYAPQPITLRSIARSERRAYQELVQKHIGANYDQIDASFAARTLQVHDLGYDPAGFFTTRKEVLAVENASGRCIGFTTLTYKSGKAVKTGPTILLKRYQKKGYGQGIRRAVEARAREAGARKVYCTAADTASDTVRYLLASGLRVEAHLARHYSLAHDELVFGKFLIADDATTRQRAKLPRVRGYVVNPAQFSRRELAGAFRAMFSATWHEVDLGYARRIVAQAIDSENVEYSNKPKRLVCLRAGDRCIAAIVLLPKRGGAVKGLMLRRTNNLESLGKLVTAGAALATALGQRKLYFLHPVEDAEALHLFRSVGFFFEGVLRAPYVPGQDVIVASKFL